MKRTLILDRWTSARQVLPRDVYFWLKALLLALVAVQGARLFWSIITPLGPVGNWLPATPQTLPAAAQIALISTFDPFSRGRPQAVAVSTSAMPEGLKLFGTRMGSGSIAGSAIIQGADGVQTSFTIGDEVAPGVRLAGVSFDFVMLDTGAGQQKLVMEGTEDAAPPALVTPATASPTGSAIGAAPVVLTPESVRQNVAFAPRTAGNRITGLLVSPIGSDAVLRAAGLRSGDIVVAVNGRRLTSAADISSFQSQVVPGARLSLLVERGAETVPVALTFPGTR